MPVEIVNAIQQKFGTSMQNASSDDDLVRSINRKIQLSDYVSDQVVIDEIRENIIAFTYLNDMNEFNSMIMVVAF